MSNQAKKNLRVHDDGDGASQFGGQQVIGREKTTAGDFGRLYPRTNGKIKQLEVQIRDISSKENEVIIEVLRNINEQQRKAGKGLKPKRRRQRFGGPPKCSHHFPEVSFSFLLGWLVSGSEQLDMGDGGWRGPAAVDE